MKSKAFLNLAYYIALALESCTYLKINSMKERKCIAVLG